MNDLGIILSIVIGIVWTGMAIHDKGDYRKYGPRELYILIVAIWIVGFCAGLTT